MTRNVRSHLLLTMLAAVVAFGGCNSKPKVDKRAAIPSRYTQLPAKKVPAVFKDTIYEKCDLINTEPFLVSGYGLVSNLAGTGSGEAPNAVREYMVKEMMKHQVGGRVTTV